MARTVEHEFTVERDGKTITLTAKAKGYYDGGYYGLPEDSYPAEGAIEELELFDEDDKPWTGQLTDDESTKLDEALMEKIMESYDGGDD